MKKIIIGFVMLAVLFFFASAAIMASFDVDRLRPLIIEKLETALGQPVQLEHLELGWNDGVAIQVLGITIGPRKIPLVKMEAASAVVRLLPLFKKRLEVASIVLVRPQFKASREASGELNLAGLAPAAAPIAAKTAQDETSAVSFEIERFRIENGVLDWTDFTQQPPLNLKASLLNVVIGPITPGRPMEINITAALASDQQNLHLSGRLTLAQGSQPGSLEQFRLAVSRLPLTSLIPPPGGNQPYLSGLIGVELQGDFFNLSPEALIQKASGSGSLMVDEPVIMNLNVLREVFQKLSMLPGLVQRLEERLPPEYKNKLKEPNTVLRPIRVSALLEEGWIRFEQLELEGDAFVLSGRGGIALAGDVLIRGFLKLDPHLSDAVIQSVEELRALADEQGRLSFPITVQGTISQVSVIPDLNAIASKVVVGTAMSALGRLLNYPDETQAEGDAQSGSLEEAAPATSARQEDLLGGILRRVIEKNLPSSRPAQ